MPAPAFPAPTVELAALARSYADPAIADSFPSGPQRRWILLHRDDAHEAWAIAWPVGTGLAMHDHDGSHGHLTVLAGELRERYVADRAVRTRSLVPGPGVDLPDDHIHEVVNIGPGEALSIHVYAPPLRDVRNPSDELRWLPGYGTDAPANTARV
jgi:hypothetical protein